MDLSEMRAGEFARHPWERARAAAIIDIIGRERRHLASILDYGCGDLFTGLEARSFFGANKLVAFDVNFPEHRCGLRDVEGADVELIRVEESIGTRRFELVLLCDVIEHVPDDVALLRSVAQRWLASTGLVLVTVPAFQSLFSNHDRALKHYRRYSGEDLRDVLARADLFPVADGYLFGSLLPARFLAKLREHLHGDASDAHGIGQWSGGELLTNGLTRFLKLDNELLIAAARRGLKLPGLTAWALCKAQ
jgi:hypothetical protein